MLQAREEAERQAWEEAKRKVKEEAGRIAADETNRILLRLERTAREDAEREAEEDEDSRTAFSIGIHEIDGDTAVAIRIGDSDDQGSLSIRHSPTPDEEAAPMFGITGTTASAVAREVSEARIQRLLVANRKLSGQLIEEERCLREARALEAELAARWQDSMTAARQERACDKELTNLVRQRRRETADQNVEAAQNICDLQEARKELEKVQRQHKNATEERERKLVEYERKGIARRNRIERLEYALYYLVALAYDMKMPQQVIEGSVLQLSSVAQLGIRAQLQEAELDLVA